MTIAFCFLLSWRDLYSRVSENVTVSRCTDLPRNIDITGNALWPNSRKNMDFRVKSNKFVQLDLI